MTVDRSLWNAHFTRTSCPWPCPKCSRSTLSLQPERLSVEETSESKDGREDPYWEPHMYMGRFTAMLGCSNHTCGEVIALAGVVLVEEEQDPDAPLGIWNELLVVRYSDPAPRLISVPESTPQEVSSHLAMSFRLLWADPSSAGNCVRIAVERLMDAQGVRKTMLGKKRRLRLSLHERLKLFGSHKPDEAEHLSAVKWLGNAASHNTLTRDQLFDAYDIVEQVLDDLYSTKRASLTRLAKAINKAKGPVRPRAMHR